MVLIPFARPDISEDEIAAVVECLKSGWITTGPITEKFEHEFADFVNARHAIAVNSATMGALLVLAAWGIGPGDEVIVPTYTFSGPAMMARHLGATVVFADSEPEHPNLWLADIERKITKRTRVIMPTHFGGSACNMVGLQKLVRGTGIKLLEDAAHALSGVHQASHVRVGCGDMSDAAFFSFYATKTLTTGEGGMVTTNDSNLANRLRKLRLHGFDRPAFDRYTNPNAGWDFEVAAPGWKANLTDMASAIGRVQLRRQLAMRERRRQIAGMYRTMLPEHHLQLLPSGYRSAYHLFTIGVDQRDTFIKLMAEQGVQCSVHFKPLHMHSAWKGEPGAQGEFPHAEYQFRRTVSLPFYSTMTDDEVNFVTRAVVRALDRLPKPTE